MKSLISLTFLLIFLAGCNPLTSKTEENKTTIEKPKITFITEMQKISYCIGLDHGITGNLYYSSEQLQGKFNLKDITQGLSDYLTGAPLRIQPNQLDSIFNLYLRENGNIDSSLVSCADGSYAMGINEANALVSSLVSRKIDQDIVVDLLVKGIEDGMLNRPTAIPYNEAKIELVAFYADINRSLGEEFLANNKLRDGVKETETGLQYEVFKEGTGVKPNLIDSVLIHFTGKLITGVDFESTIPSQKPLKVNLLNVISGWAEGLQLMKEGSQYRFFIPYQLAYGEEGNAAVEPYSAVVYDIDLIKVYRANR
jgi:FKBP-type peptidyl-prolyl cis-trans isomerase FklB